MKRLLVLGAMIAVMVNGTAYAQNLTDSLDGKLKLAYAETNAQANTPTASEATPSTTGDPGIPTEPNRTIYGFGPSVGVYMPTDSEVRDRFGSNWTRYGLRPLPLNVPPKWVPSFDISYYAMSNEDNDARVIPITVGIIRGYPASKSMRAYTSINAGPYYGSVQIPDDKIDESGWGLNVNATAGVVFKRRWSLEARYEFMNDLAGLNFNAFTISATLKVYEARF